MLPSCNKAILRNGERCKGVCFHDFAGRPISLTRSKSSEQGQVLHGIILKLSINSNSFPGNALVNMCAKCGDLRTFGKMEVRDGASCNALMGGFLCNGYPEKSPSYFREMSFSGVLPDSESILCNISMFLFRGYDEKSNVSVANSLISSSSKSDDVNAVIKGSLKRIKKLSI